MTAIELETFDTETPTHQRVCHMGNIYTGETLCGTSTRDRIPHAGLRGWERHRYCNEHHQQCVVCWDLWKKRHGF